MALPREIKEENTTYPIPANYYIRDTLLLKNNDRVAYGHSKETSEQVIFHIKPDQCLIYQLQDKDNLCGQVFALDEKHILVWKHYDPSVKVFSLDAGKVVSAFNVEGSIEGITKLTNAKVAIATKYYSDLKAMKTSSKMQLWNLADKTAPALIAKATTPMPEVCFEDDRSKSWGPSCASLITSIDGRYLIEGIHSGPTYIWDTQETLQVKHVFPEHYRGIGYPPTPCGYPAYLGHLAMTQERVLIGANLFGYLEFWGLKHITDPRFLMDPVFLNRSRIPEGWAIGRITLSPDDRWLVVSGWKDSNHRMWLWNVENTVQPALIEEMSVEYAHKVHFTSEGQLVQSNGTVLKTFKALEGYKPTVKKLPMPTPPAEVKDSLPPEAAVSQNKEVSVASPAGYVSSFLNGLGLLNPFRQPSNAEASEPQRDAVARKDL